MQPADLPHVLTGKLKAFFNSAGMLYPAQLVSANMAGEEGTLWLTTGYADHKDRYLTGDRPILVDVTPEKRFAVWNQKGQKFQTGPYYNKIDAEYWCEVENKRFGATRNNFYVVEWEIKKDDV